MRHLHALDILWVVSFHNGCLPLRVLLLTVFQARSTESMPGGESNEAQGETRHNGQDGPRQRPASNPDRQSVTEAPSRLPNGIGGGDYFQRDPKQSETSKHTRCADSSTGASLDNRNTRPAMTRCPSTSTSYTLERMNEDPKNSEKMSRVMAQLDDEGMGNLEQLIQEFAKQRAKPKGQLTSMDYRDQNPWYDKGRNKPNFSLGEPLPHVGEDGGKTPGREQVRASTKLSPWPDVSSHLDFTSTLNTPRHATLSQFYVTIIYF
jgi:hypothetical protein